VRCKPAGPSQWRCQPQWCQCSSSNPGKADASYYEVVHKRLLLAATGKERLQELCFTCLYHEALALPMRAHDLHTVGLTGTLQCPCCMDCGFSLKVHATCSLCNSVHGGRHHGPSAICHGIVRHFRGSIVNCNSLSNCKHRTAGQGSAKSVQHTCVSCCTTAVSLAALQDGRRAQWGDSSQHGLRWYQQE